MDSPITLSIAGSDSGGGAGIQADIKAISATGGYACSVITALTAQNTQKVSSIFPITPEFISAQLDAVFSDLAIKSVKIGMLANAEVILAVAEKIKQYQPKYLVLDPVMIATSGDPLLDLQAINTLKQALLPLADLITPNLPEAAALLAKSVPQSEAEIKSMILELQQAAKTLHQINKKSPCFLLKGGHLSSDTRSRDWLITIDTVDELSAPRINTRNTHGTGCTLSSAIASYLAQGQSLTEAVNLAKSYITQALIQADKLNIGKGHGPVNHFYMLESKI